MSSETPIAPEVSEATETVTNPPKAITLAVGESTPVDQAQLDLILPTERQLHQLLLNLGAHTEKAHQESILLQANVQAARKQFEEAIKAAGIATGLNFNGDFIYSYNNEFRSFTRTK
jgi:hypothetical protein